MHRFCVHLDIRACFPSVELDILRGTPALRIRDARFLAILDRLLDAGAGLIDRPGLRVFLGVPEDWPPPGRGLPIGAYKSQVCSLRTSCSATSTTS